MARRFGTDPMGTSQQGSRFPHPHRGPLFSTASILNRGTRRAAVPLLAVVYERERVGGDGPKASLSLACLRLLFHHRTREYSTPPGQRSWCSFIKSRLEGPAGCTGSLSKGESDQRCRRTATGSLWAFRLQIRINGFLVQLGRTKAGSRGRGTLRPKHVTRTGKQEALRTPHEVGQGYSSKSPRTLAMSARTAAARSSSPIPS